MAAVATGLQRTGWLISSAALLLAIVLAAFSTSRIIFIQQIGVGLAIAVIMDATLVRGLLAPATMRLLGRWNWWGQLRYARPVGALRSAKHPSPRASLLSSLRRRLLANAPGAYRLPNLF